MGFVAHNIRPSRPFLSNLMACNKLHCHAVHKVADERMEEVSRENVAEPIARLKKAMRRNNMSDQSILLNRDQSGSSFAKMIGRSIRKGCVSRQQEIMLQNSLKTKAKPYRAAPMTIVSVSGKCTYQSSFSSGKTRISGGWEASSRLLIMSCFPVCSTIVISLALIMTSSMTGRKILLRRQNHYVVQASTFS